MSVSQHEGAHSEILICGTVTGYWWQQCSDRALRGTERNGIVWDWYWLLAVASGVRVHCEGQSQTVTCWTVICCWEQQVVEK